MGLRSFGFRACLVPQCNMIFVHIVFEMLSESIICTVTWGIGSELIGSELTDKEIQ